MSRSPLRSPWSDTPCSSAPITFSVPLAYYEKSGRQLYRVSTTWISASGTSRVTQPGSYLYVTPNRLEFVNSTGAINEVLPGRPSAEVCPFDNVEPGEDPFGVAAQSSDDCWSKANGSPVFSNASKLPVLVVEWVMPVLIAAIDPTAEAKLDGLDHTLVSGNYLNENANGQIGSGQHLHLPRACFIVDRHE